MQNAWPGTYYRQKKKNTTLWSFKSFLWFGSFPSEMGWINFHLLWNFHMFCNTKVSWQVPLWVPLMLGEETGTERRTGIEWVSAARRLDVVLKPLSPLSACLCTAAHHSLYARFHFRALLSPWSECRTFAGFGGTRPMETTPPPGVAELDISEHTLSVWEIEKRQNLQKSRNKGIKRALPLRKNGNQAA